MLGCRRVGKVHPCPRWVHATVDLRAGALPSLAPYVSMVQNHGPSQEAYSDEALFDYPMTWVGFLAVPGTHPWPWVDCGKRFRGNHGKSNCLDIWLELLGLSLTA
jgi:hypothetical protein